MTKCTGGKFTRAFTAALLTALLPLLLNSNGWAQNSIDPSIKSYIEQLTDDNPNNNQAAFRELKKMGDKAVDPLIKVLEDKQQIKTARWRAAEALREIGPKAENAVDILIQRLQDPREDRRVRSLAADALGEIGPAAKPAVDALINVLKVKEQKNHHLIRFEAVGALGKITSTETKTIIYALEDPNSLVRSNAESVLAQALENIKSPERLKTVLDYVRAEAKKSTNWHVKLGCAYALGSSGRDVKTSADIINELLQEKDEEIKESVLLSLQSIQRHLYESAPDINSLARLKDIKEGLQKVRSDLSNSKDNFKSIENPSVDEVVADLDKTINLITDLQRRNSIYHVVEWIGNYPYVSGFIIYIFSLLSLSFTLLWLRPLWLLKINDALLHLDIPLPPWLGNIKIPSRYVLVVSFFHYHPRVLDAWVATHLETTRDQFQQKTTVKEREVHISIPVVLNGKNIADLTSKRLQPQFAEKVVCLLIWGEGGVGKTSLACQLAKWAMSDKPEQRLCKHRMLPILLEQELDFQVREGKQVLIEAIRGQLRDLINSAVPIAEPLLQQLLRQQRLLVIVDHFSEMSEETRQKIRPQLPEFPINTLVVTSRREEKLGGVNKTTLKPMRVEGNRLSSFMEAYLTQQGKRNLFTDKEFFQACSQLSAMAGGDNITVLLAKLYADQMIAAKAKVLLEDIPNNIPELMLHYLNQLNQSVTDRKLDNRTVHHDAKVIAWECLKRTYHPTSAKRDAVLTVLDQDEPEVHLDYLEKLLRIIQTVGAAEDQIRFTLDPLAEYLAGLYLVELYKDNEELWHTFLEQVDSQPNSPESIRGFLLAVRDCYVSSRKEAKISQTILDELNQRVGFN
ncbi:MAG: HEAT repeat domain-containing protein [Calothrix sp. MO_192.B10]|nr:HEAT repeat domain-containing protein [Calothrix sp. MO_192.B10]